jgi:hypothetical protein
MKQSSNRVNLSEHFSEKKPDRRFLLFLFVIEYCNVQYIVFVWYKYHIHISKEGDYQQKTFS